MLDVWEFPGGPEAETLHFHCRGIRVQLLVGELRVPHALVWPNINK